MIERPDLGQVLADAREQAAILRAAGHDGQAQYVESILDRVQEAAADYIVWLPESDAIIRSGLSERALRRRFGELLDCGLARYGARRAREYRQVAIPPRANLAAARERGRTAA